MNASLINRFRSHARGVSLALVLAFLLPVLLAVLPQPALSAEAQLTQDLVANLCVPGQDQSPAAQHDDHDCCILCATGLPPVGEGKLLGGIPLPAPVAVRGFVLAVVAQAPPQDPLFATAISLRGPPSHL